MTNNYFVFINYALHNNGYLFVGAGGACLHIGELQLRGMDPVKARDEAVTAGLPVIDASSLDGATRIYVAACAPRVATDDKQHDAANIYTYKPLNEVAAFYQTHGATIYNIDGV